MEAGVMARLAELKGGDEARVVGFDNPADPYARQLLSLGLIPGTRLRVERFAPLGDPIEIQFRGARLVLRPSEASGLELQKL
jgi:ferrous iron transport protein A